MALNVRFDEKELPELRMVLDRAMNTLEPQKQPAWLGQLSDKVDEQLTGMAVAPYSSRAEEGGL